MKLAFSIALWVASIGLMAVCLLVSCGNWQVFYYNYVKRDRFVSAIPFIGGLLGMAAVLLVPIDGFSQYWWLPLMLDWGSVPVVLFSLGWRFLYWMKESNHRSKE